MTMTDYVFRKKNAIKDVILTPCQDKAIDEIIAWYRDTDGLTWTLAGSAGTGKSFTTKILKKILPYRDICISAPTHKALRVAEGFTDIRGETLHRLLGLAPNFDLEDFDIKNPKFDSKNSPTIGNYDLVIMDEASMIQKDLFDFLVKEATMCGCRILFIGDSLQLPPVSKEGNEFISQAFSRDHVGGISYLRTPARQSLNDPHYILLTALRCDIGRTEEDYELLISVADHYNDELINATIKNRKNFGGTFGAIIRTRPEMTGEDGNGYKFYNDKYEYVDLVVDRFSEPQFAQDPNYCRFLAFMNDTVTSWNQHIRTELIASYDALTEGDLVMAYRTIYNHEMQPVIINSNEYVIKEVFNDKAIETIRYQNVLKEFEIPYFYVRMEDMIERGKFASVNILHPPYDSFKSVHSSYLRDAKAHKRWMQYYGFKNKFLIHGVIPNEYDEYTLPTKDIDYAYGITVHKSQGSTYDYAYANLTDILKHSEFGINRAKREGRYTPEVVQQINDVTLKLAYVALSRARKFVGVFYSNI